MFGSDQFVCCEHARRLCRAQPAPPALESTEFVTSICIAPPDSHREGSSADRAKMYRPQRLLFNSIVPSVSIAALTASIQIPVWAESDNHGDIQR